MKTLKERVEKLIDQGLYTDACNLLAESFNLEFKVEFLRNDFYFPEDKDKRDVYKITLSRGSRKYTFEFGQSVMNSQYYQDSIQGRTYTLNGGCRTGNYSINDIQKYQNGGQKLTLIKGIEPTLSDVLACLQKYDVGTFEDFCSEFGYDTDSKRAEKTYKAVSKEYDKMCSLFSDSELDTLSLIC